MSTFKTVLQPAGVKCPPSLAHCRPHECEFTLNIGIFFDGTDNNRRKSDERANPGLNTNVTRLWQAYRLDEVFGYFSYYVSGVGTPFYELNKTQPEAFGGPTGAGGEARILYGLLQVVNSVHQFINKQDARFDVKELAALCSTARVPSATDENPTNDPGHLTAEQRILDSFDLPYGLIGADDRNLLGLKIQGERRKFFSRTRQELTQQVLSRETLPKIGAIYIDVFGFSRGAAQARVFRHWLHEYMLMGGQLFGVPSCVRMLGLFDTVASVGLTNAVGSNGHNAWATADSLVIHPEVKNCVHYVALHELRTNFPLDSVARADGLLPPGVHEHHCPGVHSDVGGGYAAGDQGKGIALESRDPRQPSVTVPVKDDQLVLSMLPLNEMYRAALKSCAGHEDIPWTNIYTEAARDQGLWARFGLDRLDHIRSEVAAYFEEAAVPTDPSPSTRDALRQHGLRYLAWRLKVTQEKRFEQLDSVDYARSFDPKGLEFYRKGQMLFSLQVGLLEGGEPTINLFDRKTTYQGFSRHAPAIFAEMKRTKTGSTLGGFFDRWVHDSYAGFIGKFQEEGANWALSTGGNLIHLAAEGQRYVRWRELYQGSNEGLNALLLQPGTDGNVARTA